MAELAALCATAPGGSGYAESNGLCRGFIAGFAQSYEQMLVIRTLQGLGFGGEWAVGAALIHLPIKEARLPARTVVAA